MHRTATTVAPPAPTHPIMTRPEYGPVIHVPALRCCGELPGECACLVVTPGGYITTRGQQ
ncbi:hypothetical protein GCM10018962_77540 [Dactylosporangium matsuzakiense]|uniref:hypothetical protein n=1 Tax=Dactylosporangium matsuzakiense TaxID=53360 RepID=UPI0031E6C134